MAAIDAKPLPDRSRSRADQAGETTFPEFAAAAWRAGVLHYVVDLDSRTCSYFGLHNESYVNESYVNESYVNESCVERYPAMSRSLLRDGRQ